MSLIKDEGDGNDYTLQEDETSCWITVGNTSIYIRNEGSFLGVDVYARHRECDEPLSAIWLRQPEPATDEEKGLGMSTPWCTRPQMP